MEDNVPVLISSKRLKQDFDQFQKIVINSENVSITLDYQIIIVVRFM